MKSWERLSWQWADAWSMSDDAALVQVLVIPIPRVCAVQSGSWYEWLQRWMAEVWFHESWPAERQIQQLNGESNYDGMAALVRPLKQSGASLQDARFGRVLP